MCEHRVSIRLGPRSVGGAWARVSPEIIDAIDCESLTVYHLFRQTGQTWSAARPRRRSANPKPHFDQVPYSTPGAWRSARSCIRSRITNNIYRVRRILRQKFLRGQNPTRVEGGVRYMNM